MSSWISSVYRADKARRRLFNQVGIIFGGFWESAIKRGFAAFLARCENLGIIVKFNKIIVPQDVIDILRIRIRKFFEILISRKIGFHRSSVFTERFYQRIPHRRLCKFGLRNKIVWGIN